MRSLVSSCYLTKVLSQSTIYTRNPTNSCVPTYNMVFINKPDDLYSRPWRTTSCPDLAIATNDGETITSREWDKQLGGSDHKPIFLTRERQETPPEIYQCPSWNFKKANWEDFKKQQTKTARSLPCNNIT